MAERPDAGELLDVARETLVALIGETDARHHYALRMVANAMAIARREIGAPIDGDAGELARSIAECDPSDLAGQRAIHEALVAVTRARLAVSDPKVLE